MHLTDTIVAISTPTGEGGIGIVRLSGNQATKIAAAVLELPPGKKLDQMASRSMILCYSINPKTGEKLDQVLACVMRAPHTYTREDVVEINCHGGIVPLRETLEAVVEAGARLAEPGEFTKRAFLNGRIDLAQAEAVVDIIRSKTKEGLKVAMAQLEGRLSQKVCKIRRLVFDILVQIEASIDFLDEDIKTMSKEEILHKTGEAIENLEELIRTAQAGKIYREGVQAVIAGRPNVGKSSLLNALLREARVIVTSIPGTTRDIVEEIVNIGGVPFMLRDTAGIREPLDEVEKLGVELSRKAIKEADVVLLVLDSSEPLTEEDFLIMEEAKRKKAIVALNKIDLPEKTDKEVVSKKFGKRVVKISATKEIGLNALEHTLLDLVLSGQVVCDGEAIVANVRHKKALQKAKEDLSEAYNSLRGNIPEEFVAAVLRDVLDSLGELTGETVQENLLDKIFSEFCIGK